MGLELAAVGNHEFDEGKDELLRMQNGGCHPVDDCQGPHPFTGAKFQLSRRQHVRDQRPARPCFPPYEIREFDGIPVGLHRPDAEGHAEPWSRRRASPGWNSATRPTPSTRWSPELKARGVEAIVVLIHEGGFPTGDYNECPGISGPIVDIVRKFDQARSTSWSAATPTAPMSARSTAGWSPPATNTAPSSPRSTSSSIPRPATSISARADNVIVRTATLRQGPGADRADREPTTGSPRRSPAARRASITATLSRDAQRRPAKARSATSSPTPSSPRPAPRTTAAP